MQEDWVESSPNCSFNHVFALTKTKLKPHLDSKVPEVLSYILSSCQTRNMQEDEVFAFSLSRPYLLQHVRVFYGFHCRPLRSVLYFSTNYKLIKNKISFFKIKDNIQLTHLAGKKNPTFKSLYSSMNSVGVEVFSNDEMYSVYALSWQVARWRTLHFRQYCSFCTYSLRIYSLDL